MRREYSFEEMCSERDLKYVWTCNSCGDERESEPGCNEGGQCSCGGTYEKTGETYSIEE